MTDIWLSHFHLERKCAPLVLALTEDLYSATTILNDLLANEKPNTYFTRAII